MAEKMTRNHNKTILQTSVTSLEGLYYLLKIVKENQPVESSYGKDKLFPNARSKVKQFQGGEWSPDKRDTHTELTLREMRFVKDYKGDKEKFKVSDIGSQFLEAFNLIETPVEDEKVTLSLEDKLSSDKKYKLLFDILINISVIQPNYGREIHPYLILFKLLACPCFNGYISKSEWACFVNSSEFLVDSQFEQIKDRLLKVRLNREVHEPQKSDRILTRLVNWKVLEKVKNAEENLLCFKFSEGFLKTIETFTIINFSNNSSQCPLSSQDRLAVALQLFITKCGSCQFNPVLPNEEVTAENYFYDHLDNWKAFCTEVQESPSDISVCFASKVVKDLGMPPSLLTRFLVRLEPSVYAAYSEQTVEALHFLELTKTKVLPENLTADAYESSKAVQTQIRDKMRKMKILSQEGKEANYLTVAEFLWFVNDNKDLIEGKVMEKQFKPVNATPIDNEGPRKKKRLECKTTDDVLIFRLMAALRTKPFAILAGHSGTGKSRLVRKLAYMTCNVEELQNKEKNSPENFCMVQVKPNWHDSMDLLGYRSAFEDKSYVTTDVVKFICKAYAYPKTPFFLCLDEMNLAPVEQYFAEFLSAMESLRERSDKKSYTSDTLFTLTDDELKSQSKLFDLGCETEVGQTYLTERGGVTIPKNLFVVGTVNMDETTCQFSRKVLDRAMTIEMTDVNFANFGKVADPSFEDLLAEDIVQLLLNGDITIKELDAEDVDAKSKLCRLQKRLASTSFAIAYRFAKEYTLFKRALEKFKGSISKISNETEGLESSEVTEIPETSNSETPEASNSEILNIVKTLDALDQMVLMKVLPRIMGRTEDVKALFTGVRDFNPEASKEPTSGSLLDILGEKSESGKKMIEIMERGGSHLTFWP